jgi:SAM-dependent methyltransferase
VVAWVDAFRTVSLEVEMLSELVMHRNCPVCGVDLPSPVWTYPKLQYYDDGVDKRIDYTVVKCGSCDALYMNPTFSEHGLSVLLEMAALSYGSSQGRFGEIQGWLENRIPESCLRAVLDVGCFDGAFLRSLPDSTHRIGIDFDERAIESARLSDPLGTYVRGDFESEDWQVPTPTLITMFHVIEHVRSPADLLENMARISDQQTLLVVETPIIERAIFDDCHGFFSPEHLTHFSRLSLSTLISRSSWNVVEWSEMSDYNAVRLVLSLDRSKAQALHDTQDSQASEILILTEYLSGWFKAVADVERVISQLSSETEIMVWGAGMHTEILYQLTSLRHMLPRISLFDADEAKQGRTWRGIRIEDPSRIGDGPRHGKLLISSYQHTPEIAVQALGLGVSMEQIVRLYREPVVY